MIAVDKLIKKVVSCFSFKTERQPNTTKKSIEGRRKYRGMNDLLSYLVQLDDSTILHKDGSISRYFIYLGRDLDSSTGAELDFITETFAKGFSFLGNGWMVEKNIASQAFVTDKTTREFPELVSALLDDERRLQYQEGEYYKTTYYLSITYRPENMIESKLRKFVIEGEKKETGFDEQLAHFDKIVKEYIGFISRALLKIEPLTGNQLTSFLHYCITQSNQLVAKPELGSFLSCYISEDFIGGFEPKVADKHIKVLALDDLPSYSYPAILDELSYMPIEYRWSSRFICLDRITAKSYLKKYQRNWSSKAIGVFGVLRESMGMDPKLDLDAQNTANDLKAAQIDSSSGALNYGFYNSTLVLIHEDKVYLEKIADDVISKIQKLEFKVRQESVNAAEAYLGSLPGHGDYNLRKMLQDTRFVSHVLPLSSLYQGESKAPCPKMGYKDAPALIQVTTKGTRPFLLNLHHGDIGHSAFLGPTGTGKSTLISALACAHRKYVGSRIIVLDKDNSNKNWILALNGQYIDPEKQEFHLSPLARITPNDHVAIKNVQEWLSGCCSLQGVSMTPNRSKALREALERLAHEEQQYKNLDHLSIHDVEVREAINNFNSGQVKQMLNGTNMAFAGSDVLGFEMGSLVKEESNEQDLSVAIVKAIFNEIEPLFKDERPTILVLEEAWAYLKHPLFREKLTKWFKTLRKANVSVVFVSQDLDDIVKSDAASVIQTSCKTRIFLPNDKAEEPHIARQYEAFGLNSEQINIIKEAIPKHHYYYQSAQGNRLFSLDLGEVAQAFLCVSDKHDAEAFNKMRDLNDSSWVSKWLEYKGLDSWAEYVDNNYLIQAWPEYVKQVAKGGISCELA